MRRLFSILVMVLLGASLGSAAWGDCQSVTAQYLTEEYKITGSGTTVASPIGTKGRGR